MIDYCHMTYEQKETLKMKYIIDLANDPTKLPFNTFDCYQQSIEFEAENDREAFEKAVAMQKSADAKWR